MNKSQTKQIFKNIGQDIKQKALVYPYYPVSTKYQDNGKMFIFSIQYPNGIGLLSFVMITKEYQKKTGISGIDLAGINDGAAVSIIQIVDFKFKQSMTNVWALQGMILIGYRSGHLVLLKFKDKKTEVINKFNKSMKKDSIINRTMSFFNNEQFYKTTIRGPIKTALYCPSRKFSISYLIGNILVFLKSKQDICQEVIQKAYKSQEFQSGKNTKLISSSGILLNQKNMQICTYQYNQKQEILVSFSMQSIIKCFSAQDLSILYSIALQMPIRRVNYYYFNNQNEFLTIMPYEDYVILVDLKRNQYVKMLGHRCFIANSIIFQNQQQNLVILSAGMDHRICFDKIQEMKKWHSMTSSDQKIYTGTEKNVLKIDQSKNGIDFSTRYSLGQYQNARTNNHDYGFSDLLMSGSVMALPTYDSKMKYFALYFK